jgi:hypothetical protein
VEIVTILVVVAVPAWVVLVIWVWRTERGPRAPQTSGGVLVLSGGTLWSTVAARRSCRLAALPATPSSPAVARW